MIKKTLIYRKKVIKELCFGNVLSALDISLRIEKSLPLTTRIINELVEQGILQEKGFASSTGGRKPLMYSLVPQKIYVVAVAMDQLVTRIGLLDMQDNMITGVKRIELPLQNNPDALHKLTNNLVDFLENSTVTKDNIVGIGISMPGFVDIKKGINHSFLPAGTENIVKYIESEVEVPVLIDNDSSLMGLAELRLGGAREYKDVMVINIGWGVGLGMILDGQLFRGHNGFAGEFSHIPVFKDNKKICSCGKTGCLETETSLLVILQKAIAGLKQGRMSVLNNLSLENVEESCEAIMDAALRGDTFAVELFSEAGYNLGLGISILITLLNPELIILSGRGAAVGKLWLAPIQQAINEHCIPKIAENTRIELSTFGQRIDLISAAALVMEHFDTIPVKSQSELKIA